MRQPAKSLYWMIMLLLVIAGFMCFVVYVALPYPSSKTAGAFLLLIGALNTAFSKRFGRKFFARTQTIPPHFAMLWERVGEQNVKGLFLGVGIIFTLAGFMLLIFGSA
jgi:hypothetical protein